MRGILSQHHCFFVFFQTARSRMRLPANLVIPIDTFCFDKIIFRSTIMNFFNGKNPDHKDSSREYGKESKIRID